MLCFLNDRPVLKALMRYHIGMGRGCNEIQTQVFQRGSLEPEAVLYGQLTETAKIHPVRSFLIAERLVMPLKQDKGFNVQGVEYIDAKTEEVSVFSGGYNWIAKTSRLPKEWGYQMQGLGLFSRASEHLRVLFHTGLDNVRTWEYQLSQIPDQPDKTQLSRGTKTMTFELPTETLAAVEQLTEKPCSWWYVNTLDLEMTEVAPEQQARGLWVLIDLSDRPNPLDIHWLNNSHVLGLILA